MINKADLMVNFSPFLLFIKLHGFILLLLTDEGCPYLLLLFYCQRFADVLCSKSFYSFKDLFFLNKGLFSLLMNNTMGVFLWMVLRSTHLHTPSWPWLSSIQDAAIKD